jgi:hypothetical protein
MKQSRSLTPAVAYMRTSSAANVGSDKDSEGRQCAAIQAEAHSRVLAPVLPQDHIPAAARPVLPGRPAPAFARMLHQLPLLRPGALAGSSSS